MSIEKYKTKSSETRYRYRMYLGTDSFTGKEVRKQKGGFKSKADAKMASLEIL